MQEKWCALPVNWYVNSTLVLSAAAMAGSHNMVRAFAITPTTSCSYRSKNLDGYTCTPEIAPPVGRTVDRDSGTFGVETYEYGDVEIVQKLVGQTTNVLPMAS